MKDIESKFKNALENHEAPYDPQAWSSFKTKMDASKGASPSGGSKTLAKLGIAASVVGILSAGAYFLFSGNENGTENLDQKSELVDVKETPKTDNKDLVSDNNVNFIDNVVGDDVDGNVNENNVGEKFDEIDNSPNDHKEIKNDQNDKNELDFFLNPKNEDKKEDPKLVDVKADDNKKVDVVLNSNFTINKITGCEGMVCEFSPKQAKDYSGDYVWDFGDGTFSKERKPSHKFEKAGNYIVKLTLRSEINNKVLSDHTEEYITVYSKPKASFEVEELSNNSSIPDYSFINTTDNATSWKWYFGDKATSIKKDPSHTYRKKGIYKVRLVAENNFGCTSTYVKNINVKNDYNLLAPTGFTPNGDGRNDYFIPRALEIMDTEFTMSVFHKNGQLYYETNSVSRPWDGRYMIDNQNAASGAYVWVVKLKNKDGETEIYRGSVTLLRD